MRVLHINAGKLYGGVETLMVALAHYSNLCPSMVPEFAVCWEGRLQDELLAKGVPVYNLGETRVRRPISILQARRRLLKLLSQRKFDVVVCHMAWPQAIFAPVVKSVGLPQVFWMHDAAGRHWLERWASHVLPDIVVCNSSFTASTLPNLYPGLQAKIIPYPIGSSAPSDVGEVRAEFDTPRDSVVIIQTSRLAEWKGHRFHIQALADLRNIPNWICWMVGGAQRPAEVRYLEELKAMVASAGIADCVRFVGQRSDVPRLLAAADVFCQPNAGPEPFGIVFIEALYAGLPVVSTDIGGAPEIVDDSCGMLVNRGDVASLSQALSKLIRDPELRRRLGAQGPARAYTLCDPKRQLARLCTAFEAMRLDFSSTQMSS